MKKIIIVIGSVLVLLLVAGYFLSNQMGTMIAAYNSYEQWEHTKSAMEQDYQRLSLDTLQTTLYDTLALQVKLNHMLATDQAIRELMDPSLDSVRKAALLDTLALSPEAIKGDLLYSVMIRVDSVNLETAEQVLAAYGYPSKEVVGYPACTAIFYVIQHSDKIGMYLPIIREASANGAISPAELAMMEDRYLMNQGLPQKYGTQIKGEATEDGGWYYYVWPLQNADSVNIWRKQVGYATTVETYAKEMDAVFKN